MGYEKFVLDADQASMMNRLAGGVDLSENGLALEALLTNGPGRHFLGADHTMENFEQAFWVSELAHVDSFEQWEIDGALDSIDRANRKWKQMLAEYQPPPLDQAVHQELAEWIAARKASFPDSDY